MDEKHQEQLNRDVIETIRSAAMKLTGIKRRRFLAEIALKYCNGNPRVTEQKFGFSRAAVETGLGGTTFRIAMCGRLQAAGAKEV